MEKSVILGFLTTMATDYQGAIEIENTSEDFYTYSLLLYPKNLDLGMCSYITNMPLLDTRSQMQVLSELRNELVDKTKVEEFYYPISADFNSVVDIKLKALQPRLDHINRTIARLQREIQQTQQTQQ